MVGGGILFFVHTPVLLSCPYTRATRGKPLAPLGNMILVWDSYVALKNYNIIFYIFFPSGARFFSRSSGIWTAQQNRSVDEKKYSTNHPPTTHPPTYHPTKSTRFSPVFPPKFWIFFQIPYGLMALFENLRLKTQNWEAISERNFEKIMNFLKNFFHLI